MTNKSKKILAEISAGELLDKMTILEIKLNKIKDKEKLLEITKEYESLKETKKIKIQETLEQEKKGEIYEKFKKTFSDAELLKVQKKD